MKSLLATALLCSLYLSVSTPGFTQSQDSHSIVNGEPVSPDDVIARTTVAVGGNGGHCSASIIGKQLVMTAAHCSRRTETVHFTTDVFQPHETRPIVGLEYHPLFGNVGYHDLLIMKFEGEAPEGYHAVKLARDESGVQVGVSLVAAGFGQYPRGRLRKTKLTITDEEPSGSPDAFVFDMRHGSGICFGDSGGPALFETPFGYELVGSHTSVTTCEGWGYITKIISSVEWIREAARRLGEEI